MATGWARDGAVQDQIDAKSNVGPVRSWAPPDDDAVHRRGSTVLGQVPLLSQGSY